MLLFFLNSPSFVLQPQQKKEGTEDAGEEGQGILKGWKQGKGWYLLPILVGQVMIYPLDTIRRRMQVNGSFDHLKGGYGKGSFMSGIGAGMVRWGGMMAVQMELVHEGRDIWRE